MEALADMSRSSFLVYFVSHFVPNLCARSAQNEALSMYSFGAEFGLSNSCFLVLFYLFFPFCFLFFCLIFYFSF